MKNAALLIALTALCPSVVVAGPIDGSIWLVSSKTCNAQNQPISGKERFQFAEGLWAHIYQVSDSQDEYCNQAQAYQRIVQSFSGHADAYTEVSVLVPQAVRTVCRKKQGGAVVSDKTEPLNGAHQSLTLTISGGHGAADIQDSASCIGGTLHFELNK